MFRIAHEDATTGARVGRLKTRHGTIETPFFMPVATRACGKCLGPDDYRTLRTDAIIANSFLLHLQPGEETVRSAGGIHRFMDFDGAVFTDCGGFQMLKESFLEGARKRGIVLKNPSDGSRHLITPERSMLIQEAIGADVAMALDDVAPWGATETQYKASMENTHRWMRESLEHHADTKQLLFGIAQGGFSRKLREESTLFISSLDFDGVALGGLALGEPMQKMHQAVGWCAKLLPADKPHYLMGVGSPVDLLKTVGRGIDCFDSIFPTRNARHNTIFTRHGPIAIEKAKHREDFRPLEEGCSCPVCATYSRAYMNHLARIGEPIGRRYRQVHNLHFMLTLIRDARTAIKEDRYALFIKEFERSFSGKGSRGRPKGKI
ncbi:tRNA guanosine(34) transglycosylase Tgt [Candidatus Woesearchaeota archaeon]|nr:tRNA guanosine(34) transglycosylase Tgt [Candidatus Woesearchaeota archaeon]